MPILDDVTRGRLLYGGDYNPEQWPEEVWRQDVRLMQEAGVNLATVGVFSWARIEPRPDARDLDWLDRVLDLLDQHGIGVCLATPTASPPPWLGHRWPETLPVDPDGRRLYYGARNQFCPSSQVYRDRSMALVADLAARYAGHPALALWHVGNEYGQVCWCDETAERFRDWLRRRHGDLDGLNEAWHTVFWSQRYDSWEEVLPPRATPYLINPTQQLDFHRFCSDVQLELFTAQRDLLRQATPAVPVTTNFMSLFKQIDGFAWGAEQDVVSLDSYPDPGDPGAHVRAAFSHDLMRSLKRGQPWLLMEQAAGVANWRQQAKRRGQTRLWSLQAVARGADAVCFFQWRASRAGAEKFHSGMVPHAGAGTARFGEVRELGSDLWRLGAVAGGRVPARAALVLDWNNWWALELPSNAVPGVDLLGQLTAWYRPLWEAGIPTDVVHPSADLDGYDLLLVPNLYLVTDADAARLARRVEDGATLVMGSFSGVADERDHVRLGGYPAPFRTLLGLRVDQLLPLPGDTTVTCTSTSLGDFRGHHLAEEVHAEGAEVVATFTGGDLDGHPSVLRHRYGRGAAWYVATIPDAGALDALLRRARLEAGVTAPLADVPPGVEVVPRGDALFLLNHNEEPVTVPIGDHPRTDLLTGTSHEGEVPLPRLGAAVLNEV